MKKLSFLLTLPTQAIASVMLTVLAFGFTVNVTSCHNCLTGTDSEALSASDTPLPGPPKPPDFEVLSTSTFSTKSINVYFNIKNGGGGLFETRGIVRTVDGSYYDSNGASFATNFSISLVVPSEETSVVIYWQGREFALFGLSDWTYLSAKLNLIPGVTYYEILVNYNGKGKVVTDGLVDVSVWK